MKLKEQEHHINALTYSLKRKGIKPQHKVAFVAHSTQETVFLFFALFRLQAIACPLSPRLPSLIPFLTALNPDFFLEPQDLTCNPAPLVSYEINPDQLATLLFTSGSTGTPKIAAHTYANHIYSALGMNLALSFSEEHSWHLSLPLHHVSGISILFRCLLANASLLLPPIPIQQATHLSLVPTQVLRLTTPLKSTILVGGGPIPHFTHHPQLKLKHSYGLTEMSSTVTVDGTAVPFREFQIASDGEILVRGPTLFKGYYPHLNQNPDSWYQTQDLGKLQNAQLEIIGRKDNLFISGGENIQPEEIEKELLVIEGIMQAIIVPKQDPEWGACPVAFIETINSHHTLASIQKHLEKTLPRFKLPIEVHPLPTSQFKPSRKALEQLINSKNCR